MFSPRPPNVWWWYNIEAELENGSIVEMWKNGAIFTLEPNTFDWERPDPIYPSFKNHRWFKYFENGYNTHPANEQIRLEFGKWLCREYNKLHPKNRLRTYNVVYMPENIDMDELYDAASTPGLNSALSRRTSLPKDTLWNHICYLDGE
eukprot:TRINITY_DN410_c0_g1_i8.p2 TRINITY_DN410_c0_g1~~TRINITY_DN410_c0_g1_i8.p2  ORF type:complete len:148 (-),score=31.45 TRINITY_DN410_c0_g1_i8:10-453(-)